MAKTEKEKASAEPVGSAIDAKGIQKKAAQEKRVIKLNDRIPLIILKDHKQYKKGQKIAPHRIYGEALLEDGIAEKWDRKAEREAEAAEKKKRKEVAA